jgi:hypothetical protein
LVLAELAERLGQALKDEAELNSAVNAADEIARGASASPSEDKISSERKGEAMGRNEKA